MKYPREVTDPVHKPDVYIYAFAWDGINFCKVCSSTASTEAEFLTKVLRVFLPCYSQSPPQLYLEISLTYCIYTVKLLYTVKEKGGKHDRKPYPSPSLWFKKSIKKPQVWKLSRLCPETSTKLYVHKFAFCTRRFRFIDHHSGLVKQAYYPTNHAVQAVLVSPDGFSLIRYIW
jgi:hypothetical protein